MSVTISHIQRQIDERYDDDMLWCENMWADEPDDVWSYDSSSWLWWVLAAMSVILIVWQLWIWWTK